MTEIEALQNAVRYQNTTGLAVLEWFEQDKRKSVKMYYLQLGKETISPKLDYENMNYFLLGMSRGKRLNDVKVIFADQQYNYLTNVSALSTKEDASLYFIGKYFDMGAYPDENLQICTEIEFTDRNLK